MLLLLVVFMAILSASNFLFKTGFSIKEQVSSPLSAQILEFCESELFPDQTVQNSEVASSSNCCYDDHSSYTTNLSFPPDIIKYPTPAATTDNFSIIFDEEITENDINSVNLDFTTSPHLNLPPYQFNNQDQFDLTLLQNQIPLANDPILPYPSDPMALPTVCEDDGLSSKLMRLNNPPSSLNCSFMDPSISSYLSGNTNPPLPVETSGIFGGDLFLGELDFKGDSNGIFCPDPLPRPYNSSELQALSNESQHLVNGGGSSTTPLASEITSLDAETFRVTTSKLTTEERKEKIHRYLKKRNERNFSKKIKYACRKSLADSRPRVRGRFAKNDEFGENNRSNGHEEDAAEDVKSFHVVVKEEDENFESSDIFAHISGVNSFKCNYPIQSWI
ncbi:putative transcription factor C2C2-CO-like family [Helianthus debilis subsp. tardiflorus]